MSRGVPARNLVMRALNSLTERYKTAKALQDATLEAMRKDVGTVTGAMKSSLNSFLARRRSEAKRYGRTPHQGKRECARRRGDWAAVSAIDAFKRYPYGINHRFPSINRPDRVEVSFPNPDQPAKPTTVGTIEPSRIIVPTLAKPRYRDS